MAEIDIKKKTNNIWPWIVAAIVVLAVILYFVLDDDDDRVDDGMEIETEEPVGVLENFAHPGTETVYYWTENSTNYI